MGGLLFHCWRFLQKHKNTIYPRVLSNQSVGGILFSKLETYDNAGDSSIVGIELNVFLSLKNIFQ